MGTAVLEISVPWVFSSLVVQYRSAPLGLRRQDTRRGLCYAGKRGEIGGVIKPRIHLSQSRHLSNKAGPPLIDGVLRERREGLKVWIAKNIDYTSTFEAAKIATGNDRRPVMTDP